MPEWSVPRALVAALSVAILLALLVGGMTSTAAFGAFNPAWDGTAEFRSVATETGGESAVLRDVAAYEDRQANGTLAVVLSPAEPYKDATAVQRFVQRGGTLLVAEDHGEFGNDLLSAVGATARVDGRPLRDERTHGSTPAFPAITNVSDDPLAGGADALRFNHGTAVDPGNASVLAATSSFAYLDDDGDGELDDAESLGTRPVATVESVGAGRVIAVGDPSLFINAMVDARENRAFARGLVGSHERVVLDVSRAGGVPAVVAAQLALTETPWLQLAGGGGFVLAVAGWRRVYRLARRIRSWRDGATPGPETLDREALATVLADRYPEWNDDRIRHVTDTIMSRQVEVPDNDTPE